MPKILMITIGLLLVLLVLAKRFIKPRITFTDYLRREYGEQSKTLQDVRQSLAAITDAEALQPVLSALAEIHLPQGVTLHIENEGDCAQVTVNTPQGPFCLHLAHTHFRRARQRDRMEAGQWLVRLERGIYATKGASVDARADAPVETAFTDLAACVKYLQTIIAPRV